MTECAFCGAPLKQGAAFCARCGKPHEAKPICPACGADLEPDLRFCIHCGQALEATVPVAAAAADEPDAQTMPLRVPLPAASAVSEASAADVTLAAGPRRSSSRLRWAVPLALVLIAGGAAAALFLGVGREGSGKTQAAASGRPGGVAATSPSASPAQGKTSTSPTPSPSPQDVTPYVQASASSHLRSQAGVTYTAANLLDGDLSTCWAEGVPGYGQGEVVRFTFDTPLALTELRVVPGYAKKLDGWSRWWPNGRLASVELAFSDGTSRSFDFRDSQGWQVLSLDGTVTSWVKMTILSTYPARPGKHAAEDTSVSEVRFTGRQNSQPAD